MLKLLRKVGIIDTLIMLVVIPLSALIARKFIFMVALGLAVAYLNFASNTILTYYIMSKTESRGIYTFLGFLGRIAVVAGIGVLAFTLNKYFVIAYLLGYSLHFISLILYGTNAK